MRASRARSATPRGPRRNPDPAVTTRSTDRPARTSRAWLLGGALAFSGVCAWSAWSLFDGVGTAHRVDDDAATAAAASASVARELEGGGARAQDDDVRRADAELDAPAFERSAEYTLTDAQTLRAAKGRVLDARTREPLSGFELSFLSRRPRTLSTTTDASGRFETAAELAPGAVLVQHVPARDSLRFEARWDIAPNQFVLAPRGSGETRGELVLLASAPAEVLVALVTLPGGAPAAEAEVALTLGERDASGEFAPRTRLFETTDADGRARFALDPAQSVASAFSLEAEQGGSLVSERLLLDQPPGARPLTLALHNGALVRAQALDDAGHPLGGVPLRLALQGVHREERTWQRDTDGSGAGLFGALRAGCYTLSALHPFTGERVETRLDLAQGAQETPILRLSVAGLRLGASGRLVDERGGAIAGASVRLRRASGETIELVSGAQGEFEFWGRPEAVLSASVAEGVGAARFEPVELVVPFGTQGLEFRRVESFESRVLAFEIVEREGGAPVRSARVVFHRGESSADGASAERSTSLEFGAPSGVVQASFPLRPGLRYAIDAPGHVRSEGTVRELLRRDPARVHVRVELERGFARTLVLRDRASGRGVEHARVSAAGRELAQTDESGRVTLELAEWPAALELEAAGYSRLLWDPASAPFPGTTVWLDPLR